MIFVLPFWLTFGRAAFGSVGWMTLIYLFTVAPGLLVAMIIITVLIRTKRDVKASRMVTDVEAWLLLILYVGVVLHGFFLVDGGDSDTAGSIKSVATEVFGQGFEDASSVLAIVFFLVSLAPLVALLILATIGLSQDRRINTGSSPPGDTQFPNL